jgi:prolipoprotein diacylglyceryl transferase
MTAVLSIPSPPSEWAQFNIGPLVIHTYAICILVGIVAAVIITQRRLSARGGAPGVVIDVILWAVPLGIVGARFYHVFTHIGDYFYSGSNFWQIFAIWDGGNALYGSLLGGAFGAYIGCRRHGIRFWSFADALAPAMLVAQALGRLGNWFNHELFGLPTTLPWGLDVGTAAAKFGYPADTLFHPLFLYEIIWNLIGIAVILFIERKFQLRWGRTWGVYLIWYGLGRSWLEAIRIDPTSDGLFGVPANIWASWVAILLGIILIVVQGKRHPGREPSAIDPNWKPRVKGGGVPATTNDRYTDDAEADAAADAAAKEPVSASTTSRETPAVDR